MPDDARLSASSESSVEPESVVLLERDDGIAWITLNRPERLNALDVETMEALRERLTEVAEDQRIRAVLVTGAGRAFCAGGDIGTMDRRREGLSDVTAYAQQVREIERYAESSILLFAMPKPTIAVVDGYAVGGGFSLALACDLRVVSTRARFVVRFQELGLSGDYGMSYFLVRALGYARAMELCLIPRTLSATDAREVGLVTQVVEPEELRPTAESVARGLAAGPTFAYAKTKENLALAAIADLRTVIQQESANTKLAALSEDARKAAQAFLGRRRKAPPPTTNGADE